MSIGKAGTTDLVINSIVFAGSGTTNAGQLKFPAPFFPHRIPDGVSGQTLTLWFELTPLEPASRQETVRVFSRSRVFRGLLDELEIYRRALELEEIQAVQRAFARRTMFEPVLTVSVDGAEVVLEWEAAASFQVQECTNLGRGVWRNLRTTPEVDGFRHTVRQPSSARTQSFLRLQGN